MRRRVHLADPTRTTGIVNRYKADLLARWTEVDRVLWEMFAVDDTLNMGGRRQGLLNRIRTPSRFEFPTDIPGKADAFDEWLRGAITAELLEPAGYQNKYVRAAYSKGVDHADRAIRARGGDPLPQSIQQTFNQPIHRDKLQLLYSRNFRELKGITDASAQSISRIVTEGLAIGQNPLDTARDIRKSINTIGRNRSITLARTETIRAHAEATLNRYQQIGITQVSGKAESAEFITARDDRVCPECADLEGQRFTLDDARGIIPVHPSCRCAWLPII